MRRVRLTLNKSRTRGYVEHAAYMIVRFRYKGGAKFPWFPTTVLRQGCSPIVQNYVDQTRPLSGSMFHPGMTMTFVLLLY